MGDAVKNGSGSVPAFQAQKGKGRPKGVVNKNTAAVKEMILAALDKAGGAEYLVRQSNENPTAFMTLLGKLIPLDVRASGDLTMTLKSSRDAAVQAAQRADG